MKHPKRIAALVITMAACAITLLGIGVAAALSSAYGNSDIDVSTTAMSLDGDGGATVSAVVDTYWNAVDEKGYPCFDASDNRIWTQDASQYRDACAASTTARLIRDGVDAVQLTFDGQVDSDWQNDSIGGDTFSWRETSPWHIEATGLPKEDSNGSAYSYLIVQNGIDGFVSEVSERGVNDDGSLFTRFRNCKGSDSSSIIPVSACWKDGGDVDSRKSIKVGLYAARDIWSSNGSQKLYYKDNLIVSVELNVENSWYTEVSVPVSGFSVSNSDFYILEESTYVDDGAYKVVSRDKLGEDNIDGHTYDSLLRYWHESDTDSRMISANPDDGSAYKVTYDINKAIGSFQVTNQRVGSVEVSVEQKWLDEGADPDKRPANALSLVAANIDNEFVYSASGEIYSRVFGLSDSQLYTKDTSGKLASLVVNKDATINNSEHSLTFNIGRIGNSSSSSIFNLPKYDASGAEINWEVREAWSGEHGDYGIVGDDSNSDMFSPVPSCEPKSWHHGDKLTFSFTNKRVGTKDVTFHAKWFDHFVKDGNNQRPELSLKLYRQVFEYSADGKPSDNTTFEEVPAGEYGGSYTWTASDAADRVPNDTAEGDFTKCVTFSGLPRYDSHGKMLVYYARPSLSSLDDTKDGQSYSYEQSVSQDNYSIDPGSWSNTDSEISSAVESASVNGSSTAYREDSTFNFHIRGSITVSGNVQWINIPEGQSSDLPNVSVYAQRRSAAGSYDATDSWKDGDGTVTSWSHLGLTVDASNPKGYTVKGSDTGLDDSGHAIVDGKTAVAWTSDFTKNESGDTWSYNIAALGDNVQTTSAGAADSLDAFDSEGRLFEYRVREVIDGMVSSAAFDESKFTSASSDAPEDAFVKLYGITYNGNSITNTYDPKSKGSLTVSQLFEGSSVHSDTPFRLYRFCQGGENKSALKLVGEMTLSNYGTSDKSVTFANLDMYTLAGKKWAYVPVEVVPENFTSASALIGADSADSDFKDSGVWAAANGVPLPTDVTGNLSMGPLVEFGDDAVAKNVVFNNAFDAGVITLSGSITWVDRDGVFGTRPADFATALKLKRASQDDVKGDELTLQSSDANAPNYFVWTAQPVSGGDSWTYEIRNLEKLTPDCKPWRYTLTENLSNTQYKLASGSSMGVSCDADSGALHALVNELKGQVSFAVSWAGDSDVRWVQRPAVHLALQAREASSGGQWSGAAAFFDSHGIAFSDTKEFEKAVDAQVTTAAWTQLPLSISSSNGGVVGVEYRVAASRYTYGSDDSAVDVDLSCDNDGKYSFGSSAYSSYLPKDQVAQQTAEGVWNYDIANEYTGGSAAVKATYSWNDSDNAFGTRPDDSASMTFALQRSVDGGASWQWVGKDGGVVSVPFAGSSLNAELLVVAAPDSSSNVSVDCLPAKSVGANGEEIGYQYRLAALVTGSYEIAGSIGLAASADNALRLEAVNPVDGAQNFVFDLLTTDITGDVTWNDYGSGLLDSVDPAASGVKFAVSRIVAGGSDSASSGSMSVTPAWSKGSDGSWSYSLVGLPKLDQNGKEWAYRVAGCDAKLPGWHFAGFDSRSAVAFDASRLTFDSLDGSASAAGSVVTKLNGIAFELSDASGDKVATWSRDNDGAVSVSVETGFGKVGSRESAGWVVGLPAGVYTVHESTVPSGYQGVADFKVAIGADGAVALAGNPSGVSLGSDGFALIVESQKAPAPSVPSGGNSGAGSGGSSGTDNNNKPDKPGASGGDDNGGIFVSEPTIEIGGSVSDDGVVTLSISATFTSADGKNQVTLSSGTNQLEIELIDVTTGACKVTIKPGCEPTGYKGDLSDAVVVDLFEGKTVFLEEVKKASSSKSGCAMYRSDDGTVYKVVIPKDNIKVSSSKKTIKASTLKKGEKKFKIEVTDAKGKVTYKSSSKKWVKVSKKGVVTVKKGTKKGTYTITITSQATSTHAKAVKHVKFKVK